MEIGDIGEQHDDHIWLTIGGQGYAVHFMHWPYMVLWRGYWPDFEFKFLDMTHFDADLYYQDWLEMIEREFSYYGSR